MFSYLKNVIFGEEGGTDDTSLPPHDHIWRGLEIKKPRNATVQFKRPSSLGTPHLLHKGDISHFGAVDSSLNESSILNESGGQKANKAKANHNAHPHTRRKASHHNVG
jgi:hypothetical protein